MQRHCFQRVRLISYRQRFTALVVVLLRVVQSFEVDTNSMYSYPDEILTKALESVPRFDSVEQEELSQVRMRMQ